MTTAAHQLSPRALEAMRRARLRLKPRENCTPAQWPERYRTIATGATPGPFRWERQPALRGILEAYGDPRVRQVVGQKSSQLGWTTSIALNVIGFHVHVDPCAMLVFFPKDKAAIKFVREKLDPTIRETPVLAERIKLGSRSPDNTQDFKGFAGGFLQLSGVNSPANIKSTDAKVAIVEEPDDVGKDVKGQGNAIAHAKARTKSFPNRKILIGGTPTYEGFSSVAKEMEISDKRRFYVACPHCGHEQTLRWGQVSWLKEAATHHPVYGRHQPETAKYVCESCAALWTEGERIAAICTAARRADAGWRAAAAFTGVAGFYLHELLSIFPESRLEVLVRSFLTAQHQASVGDNSTMIEFVNGSLGEVWKIKTDAPEVQALRDRAQPEYAEFTTPAGGLIVTGFVDVQRGGEHSGEARLELLLRAWGREEESWLVAFKVIVGNPLEQATWDELDRVLATPIRNLAGGTLGISSLGIDSGDGMTAEAVYKYVRGKRRLGARTFIATKGDNQRGREIFSPPKKSIDTTVTDKAAKFGLRPYIVGTDRAKDLISGRLKLEGEGPARMHWHAGVRPEYFAQLLAEVKFAPRGGKPEWIKKAGERNEALDCEVGVLHGARRLRLHTMTDAEWTALEARVRQPDLLKKPAANQRPTQASPPTGGGEFTW
jgi:phage terminase large subunit GpA-like protein